MSESFCEFSCTFHQGQYSAPAHRREFRPVQPEPLDLDARDHLICPASPFVILRTGKKGEKSERRRSSRDPAR